MGVVAYGSWAEARLRAIDVLFEQSSWADVVRESQEVVELALKGLLRAHGVQPPRIHDVSEVLLAERSRLPEPLQAEIGSLAEGSRRLRRDHELAFYGAEDLTPSGFYTKQDADEAMGIAHRTVSLVRPHVSGPASRRRGQDRGIEQGRSTDCLSKRWIVPSRLGLSCSRCYFTGAVA